MERVEELRTDGLTKHICTSARKCVYEYSVFLWKRVVKKTTGTPTEQLKISFCSVYKFHKSAHTQKRQNSRVNMHALDFSFSFSLAMTK